jgi:peroxiredoxin
MMRDRVMPDQIHNFAHNNEWLIRDLIHVGRVHDALDLAKNMTELPRHPKYNTLRGGSANYGRLRLFQVLNTYELWDELIALAHTPYLEPTDVDAEQIKRLRHLGAAHVRKGDVENGKKTLATLTERLQNEKTAADKAAAEAAEKAKQAGKDEKQIQAAKEEARKPFNSKITDLERALDELNGHLAIASGDAKNGLALLKKAGGVDAMYLARVRFLAGEKEEAVKDAQSYVKSHPNEVQPLAHLVALLWDAGKKTEATAAFKELREISGTIDDLHAPVFARLAPIAQQSGFPQDWRIFKLPAKDVGNRPPLDSLGPFRWQPSPAPAWKLKDVDDKTFSLKQYRGKPVVVIFYLGHKCLHCNEQLQKFGPMTDEFAKAGISLIAVSSDDANGLKTSLENYKNGAFPFPLVANPELDVFKAYRCYDDFERQPLHGTFVIDGDGLVRWQDISYEPFMDGQFVLNESKRLLEQSQTQKRVARK